MKKEPQVKNKENSIGQFGNPPKNAMCQEKHKTQLRNRVSRSYHQMKNWPSKNPITRAETGLGDRGNQKLQADTRTENLGSSEVS